MAFNQIWITLGPLLVVNSMLITSYFIYQIWARRAKERDFAGAKRGGSMILGSATREWWFWTTNPIVKLFVKLHMTPNILTATGFFFSCVAAFLFAVGSFGYAGWVMILGASFDMFDGRVARITGKCSRSGAYFDAVMDRFGEGACMIGLAHYFRDGFMLPVVILALIGSLLVSYTKARAEGMGVECNVGWMQRPERIVYLGVASVLDPCANLLFQNFWTAPPPLLVIAALIWIAIMTNLTAVYRMVHVMNKIDTDDKREKESIPQIITRLATQEGREEFWDRAKFGYDRKKSSTPNIVLFLINGVVTASMFELLSRNELPNISRHISERGSVLKAISTFPSSAAVTLSPFVTGCSPGTCDIPGSKWFDRRVPRGRVITMRRFRDYLSWGALAMDHDLSHSVRTIFEYSKQAVNIFGMLNRGCGPVRDPAMLKLGNLFYRTKTEADLIRAEEAAFHWFSSAIKRETDFVLYSFPSVPDDVDSAWNDHTAYLKRVDSYIGRAAEVLKSNNMYDDTLLMLAGTHGVERARGSFDLMDFLSKRYTVCTAEDKFKNWQSSNLIALESGTSMSHLYVRNVDDWSERSFFEDIERRGLIGSLLEQEAVEVIAGRSLDGGIVAQTRNGKAHILEDADGRITYLAKGSDPFGLAPQRQIMDSSEALQISSGLPLPDAVFSLLQIFRSRRSGDLVLSAKPQFSIIGGKRPVTSGSLSRPHVEVPLIISQPVENGIVRTADVFAFILSLFGIEPEHGIDGNEAAIRKILTLDPMFLR